MTNPVRNQRSTRYRVVIGMVQSRRSPGTNVGEERLTVLVALPKIDEAWEILLAAGSLKSPYPIAMAK